MIRVNQVIYSSDLTSRSNIKALAVMIYLVDKVKIKEQTKKAKAICPLKLFQILRQYALPSFFKPDGNMPSNAFQI